MTYNSALVSAPHRLDVVAFLSALGYCHVTPTALLLLEHPVSILLGHPGLTTHSSPIVQVRPWLALLTHGMCPDDFYLKNNSYNCVFVFRRDLFTLPWNRVQSEASRVLGVMGLYASGVVVLFSVCFYMFTCVLSPREPCLLNVSLQTSWGKEFWMCWV